MVDLGILPGGKFSTAIGVSQDGSVVVGDSNVLDDVFLLHGFKWTAAGGMVDLGINSQVTGVSQDGNVVVGFIDSVNVTLTYTADNNGTIYGTADQTIVIGNNGTQVTAKPNPGFRFVKWSDDVLTPTRTDLNVQATISVKAIFDIDILFFTYQDHKATTGKTIFSDNAVQGFALIGTNSKTTFGLQYENPERFNAVVLDTGLVGLYRTWGETSAFGYVAKDKKQGLQLKLAYPMGDFSPSIGMRYTQAEKFKTFGDIKWQKKQGELDLSASIGIESDTNTNPNARINVFYDLGQDWQVGLTGVYRADDTTGYLSFKKSI
jgi:probable HAF family extracellular repeat protein